MNTFVEENLQECSNLINLLNRYVLCKIRHCSCSLGNVDPLIENCMMTDTL